MKYLSSKSKKLKSCIKFEDLLRSAPQYIYWKDLNSVYQGCNTQMAEAIGLKSRDEIIGLTDFDLAKKLGWFRETIKKFINEDKQIIKHKKPITFEHVVKAVINEGGFFELVTKAPIFDANHNLIGIMGLSFDISQQKIIEKTLREAKETAEQANLAKANFLATMSHELRTPMNGILGMAQGLLRDKNLSDKNRKMVENIFNSGEGLLQLINDILDFSKIEAGKLSVRPVTFNFHKLLKNIYNAFYHQVEDKKDLKLTLDMAKDVPELVVADMHRIRQIVNNFVGNALKFTDKGFVKILVKCESRTRTKAKIFVSVQDSGLGIPKNKQKQVFERFMQIESRYSRKYHGTGLGLAISKQLIEKMHGEIGLTSKYRKGSTFWFRIPVKIPKKGAKVEAYSSAEITNKEKLKPLPKAHVLLIEDNKLNQLVAKDMLDSLGLTSVTANDGPMALKMYPKVHYDLVLSDIGLPGMDGFEVIQELRKMQRADKKKMSKRIPIVALTAHVMEEDRQRCMDAGADDVIIKPVMFENLHRILLKYLKK